MVLLLCGASASRAVAAAGDDQALFDLAQPGAETLDADGASVELGVRFEASVPFVADGIALYRPTGRPVADARVRLWDGDRLLATGHAGELADGVGWVRVRFDGGAQVLEAGHEYVASYASQGGDYVATTGFFAEPYVTAGGALRAPGDAGVYSYSQAGGEVARPTQTWEHSNYWVTPYGKPLAAGPWALFAPGTAPSEPPAVDGTSVEPSVRFSVAEPPAGAYRVTAVRFHRAPLQPMVENRVFIRDAAGAVVAEGLFIGEGGPTGVVDVRLQEPVTLHPGETYTASYVAQNGGYSYEQGTFDLPVEVGPIKFPADAGALGNGSDSTGSSGTSYYVSPVIELDAGSTLPAPQPLRDATIPSVVIVEPAGEAVAAADTPFYVRAQLTDDGGVLQDALLLVDGAVVESVPNPGSGSTVNFPVMLSPGLHRIEIRAEDPAGNADADTLQLTAAPPGG
jgi:hypothetical protein